MAKIHRGGTKPTKKKAAAPRPAAQPRPKRSAKRLRSFAATAAVDSPVDSPMIFPVRTATTPRPELTVPIVSLENVDWEDVRDPVSPLEAWTTAQRSLERRLGEIGAADVTRSLDLKAGRCVFLDGAGVAVAEARAQLIGSWFAGADRLVMAWADPVMAPLSIARLDEMGDMLDVDVATARELVLRASTGCGAEHVLPVEGPCAEHYVALRSLRASVPAAATGPTTPVGAVLDGLSAIRRNVASRDEPTDVLRSRLVRLGKSLQALADGSYRGSEWVGRLERAAKVVQRLGSRLVPPTFTAIAAGREAEEWLTPQAAHELVEALTLLEDEWRAFH